MNRGSTKRMLILGGGFGGVITAQRLHRHFKRDASVERDRVEITLVNRDNFFVFVPLLASVASGSIETFHILNPIRRMIPGISFRAEEYPDRSLHGCAGDPVWGTGNARHLGPG